MADRRTGAAARIAASLARIVARDELSFDEDLRRLLSADLFYQGHAPAAVLRPRSIDSLARAVAAATAAGLAIVPRGGGLSYSAGYVADRDDVLMIDMRGLGAIGEVDLHAGTVTVEAGCTWGRLYDHLGALGVRTRFWGPASGAVATIGGTLSQDAVLLGSGRHGFAGENVLAMQVLLADGTLLRTPGPGAPAPSAFVGDCGALGLKVELTLPLEPLPAHAVCAAFRFPDADGAIQALTGAGRRRLAAECFLFDPWSSDQRAAADASDVWVEPLPGQRRRAEAMHEVHASFEADAAESAAARRRSFAEICEAAGGQAMGDGVLARLRAAPFGPPVLMVGPGGRRWLPVHFIVPHGRLRPLLAAIRRCVADHAALIHRHDISWGWSALLVGSGRVLVEPSLYWADAQPPLVGAALPAEVMQTHPTPDPAARAAVGELRVALIEAGAPVGARHIQVGRIYPPGSAFAGWDVPALAALKARLDPSGQMNPGVLGLGDPAVKRSW